MVIVSVTNIFQKDQTGNEIPVGLSLEVQVKAASIDEAITEAKGIADLPAIRLGNVLVIFEI